MIKAQVVIVGGGIMGVSLMYHLVKAGWKDILLLEKHDLTHGSTWHAAGLCTHFAHNATVQELRATSVRLYRDILPKETGNSCGFHRSGAMRITRNRDRMDEFAHVAGLSQFTGYPLELLTPERIAELHPLTQLDGLIGGIYEPDDGHVDPSMATNAMATVATRGGATIKRFTPVRAIRKEQSHWLVDTDTDTIKAQHIVNAAGTWAYEVGQMMGLNIPSVPVLHQYLVTDTVNEVVQRTEQGCAELPIIRDPEESWYVRQEGDGFILGPYEKEAQVWSVDGVPEEFGAELMPPDLDRVEPIIEAAMKRIPAFNSAGIKAVINGPITFTPDANPLIGPAAGLTNAWCLTGSSMGVMEGGGAGHFLAQWMINGSPPMDAIAIDSRRFGKWANRQYRIDKAVECFGLQFGVHYPYEERPAARQQRLSPLHNTMIERGAVMGAAYAKERPNWFSDVLNDETEPSFRRTRWFDAVAKEVDTITNHVALADLSVFSKFDVSGPDTLDFINTLGTNKVPKVGRVGLTYVLSANGGVASELSVAVLDQNHAYLNSAAAAETIDLETLLSHAKQFDVEVDNISDELAVIGLMGPKSRTVLSQLTNTNLESDFPWLHARLITVHDVTVRALRVSYIGELGWELHVPAAHAVSLFLALENAGEEHGIGYYGAYAANSMRLEKAYRAWGSELSTERTAYEAGLHQFIKSDNREFHGKQAMLDRLNDQAWELVLLELETTDIDPFYSHPVLHKEKTIGIITSGAYGHRCKKTLAFAYLRQTEYRDSLTVSVLGQFRKAVILDKAPFDHNNLRLRD